MLRKLISRTTNVNEPRVSREIRYEMRTSRVLVQLVNCETEDHVWGTVVLEWEHFGEPITFDFSAADLDDVCDLLNAARAIRNSK